MERKSSALAESRGGDGAAGRHASEDGAANRGCGHEGEAEPPRLAGITAAHNAIRCQLAPPQGGAPPPLSWSASLAAEAQRYADKLARDGCRLHHAETDYGENLFGGSSQYEAAAVVERWAREAQCFRYAPFPEGCSCTCGHYTQLVWSDTERLGCGMADCDGGGQVWVCRYDPAGNYTGVLPY
jgi:pathogenesis-related protein 1